MRVPAILVLGLAASTVRDGLGQARTSTDHVRLVEVRVEPAQPSFGDVFDVHVTLRLRPGASAALPDTLLPADAVESLGPGVWNVVPGPGDSVEIRAIYPVIGFRGGRVELPSLPLDIRVASAEEKRLIRLGVAELAPYPPMADLGTTVKAPELTPRPPADVLGGERSLWQLLAVAIAGMVVIGGSAVVVARRWWAAGGAILVARLLGRTPRQRALRELDRILALGWHRDWRLPDFYASTTGTLRRFAERTDPAWGGGLTSYELLTRLQERWGPEGFRPLTSAVAVAERVKFGGYRPGADVAERDWETIGDWIRSAPEN